MSQQDWDLQVDGTNNQQQGVPKIIATNSSLHPQTPQPQRNSAVSAGWNTLELQQLSVFNAAASTTPVPLTGNPGSSNAKLAQQLEGQVRHLMGNIEDLNPLPSERFMHHCCEAMLYAAQDAARQRDEAIRAAIKAFHEMVTTREGFPMTLPLLNRLSFIAEAYGHSALNQRILQNLRQTLSSSVSDKPHRDLLLDAIGLLLDTKAAANEARANRIYNSAVALTGNASTFAIAARYNHAWVLLENEQYRDALDILLQESGRCESVYGTNALQTICWLATLAWAHLMLGETLSALSLMKESVAVRAERAFNRNHPLYWEIRYRIGHFFCKLAIDNTIQKPTEDFWGEGKSLLAETLVWRAETLGPDNSQTLKALRMLNFWSDCIALKRATTEEWRSTFNAEATTPTRQ